MAAEQRISVRLSMSELLAIHQAIKLQKIVAEHLGYAPPPNTGFPKDQDLSGALLCVKAGLHELLKK